MHPDWMTDEIDSPEYMSWPEKSGYFIFFIFLKHCK